DGPDLYRVRGLACDGVGHRLRRPGLVVAFRQPRLLLAIPRLVAALAFVSVSTRFQRQPTIGALGLAPQKTRVPSIPMMWTKTIFRTIDFAVAVPTPTGPPDAV